MSMDGSSYIIGIDQSTQGTKFVLTDDTGKIVCKKSLPHRQIIDGNGWISHDMEEVYDNVLKGVKELIETSKIDPRSILCVAICNQRETTVLWDKTGKPMDYAVVWQCDRAASAIEDIIKDDEISSYISYRSGLPVSPYFPAAKMKWLIQRHALTENDDYCIGTVDSYLVFRLTQGQVYATDYSNASRTQLFDIEKLMWDEKLCKIFNVPLNKLPRVKESDDTYGLTDFGGLLLKKIPIHAVMGDSHAALFGQGCHKSGMLKTTYGTGSSMMLNTGNRIIRTANGLSSTIAFCINGQISYALEGNVNYAGAAVSWLKDKANIIDSPDEVSDLCKEAGSFDKTVMIPAFTGLSAPHYKSDVRASFLFMDRNTGKAELVRAVVDSIANQVADLYEVMEKDYDCPIIELRADGGPTKNEYLMKYQAGTTCGKVLVSKIEELSVLGVIYAAAISMGMDCRRLFDNIRYIEYDADTESSDIKAKRKNWKSAVNLLLSYKEDNGGRT